MARYRQIDCFKPHFILLKSIGIWAGKENSRSYACYTIIMLTLFVLIFDILFTLSFINVPADVQIIINEVIFYFTEVVVAVKMLVMVFKQKQILTILDMIESDYFEPKTKEEELLIQEAKNTNTLFFRVVATTSCGSYCILVFKGIVQFTTDRLKLPITNYYFMTDEAKDQYLYYIYTYQMIGIYTHMMTNINVDTFLTGLLKFAETQLIILNDKLSAIKVTINNEDNAATELKECILHYMEIEKYITLIQKVFNSIIFTVFGIGAVIICICFISVTLTSSVDNFLFLSTYFTAMLATITGPCWFGTQILYQSERLTFAAYSSDWPSCSKNFKKTLLIFMERLKRPFCVVGGKMFPVSLVTFISIMKTAYSMVALLRNVQDRESGQ